MTPTPVAASFDPFGGDAMMTNMTTSTTTATAPTNDGFGVFDAFGGSSIVIQQQ